MEINEQPLRSELFSVDLLQRHARALAKVHRVATRKGPNRLLPRLAANEKLLDDYNEQTLRVEKIRRITPAAEWLLDNFYLIEEQIQTARRHLPRNYSRELPHLVNGASANFPRVYDLALELISHVDGRVDALHLTSFVAAYQEVTPLKLGELWAIPIMLRLALIENLRRVAALLQIARTERDRADLWADRMLKIVETEPSELVVVVGELAKSRVRLSQVFVTEFWRRLQEKSASVKLALNWLEERLAAEGQTVEQLVQSESQSQAANQVSVGNSITSMRFLDAMNWREFVETLSIVEHTLREDPAGVYSRMDFPTRDAYRHVVEQLAKRSSVRSPVAPLSEAQTAELAIRLARVKTGGDPRTHHVGYYLLGKGITELEREAGVKPSVLTRLMRDHALALYLGGIAAITAVVTTGLMRLAISIQPNPWLLTGAALLILLCGSQLAVSIVNWVATQFARPCLLPRMDFSGGIPPEYRVMVVVPAMLSSQRGVEHLVEGLELRYLANRDENVYFALLTDFRDASEEHQPDDTPLLKQACEGVQRLNEKYAPEGGCIFLLFHRPRLWNPRAKLWMGYERKRGKLAAFNAILRGHRRDSFSEITGCLPDIHPIRYVITLDTDTQLPRDTARQLAGSMAHPLNVAVYDESRARVVEGYGILQPRVAVSLPSANRSRFARLFSGDPGIDPYTRAVSDVYQDLFQEGSFIGKGIYDVDAFERAVGGKFPENRILSHDLLEGSYARSGLVTDVMLFEEFPTAYIADASRRHRWIRGDWQIATWLLPRVPGPDKRRVTNPTGLLARWKIFDNLRRSVLPAALIALLILGWLAFPEAAGIWTLFVAAVIFVPGLLSTYTDLLKRPDHLPLRIHFRNVAQSTSRHLAQAFFKTITLPHDAWLGFDATVRTLARLAFRRGNLLEWKTASDAENGSEMTLANYWTSMWFAPAVVLLVGVALLILQTGTWPSALPFLILSITAPVAAWWMSRRLAEKPSALSMLQNEFLRVVARKTWRYFETFLGPQDNWLPPDNFQEFPKPVVATRTSPTNIGIAMLSTLAAWDFGYLSARRLAERLAATFDSLEKLEKFQGHLYNWYDTRTLKPLSPLYISTVDNGNFAGLLLTLRTGLLEVAERPKSNGAVFAGLRDTLQALQQTCGNGDGNGLIAKLELLETKLAAPPPSLSASLVLLDHALDVAVSLPPSLSGLQSEEFQWWRQSFERLCREQRDEFETNFPWLKLRDRFAALGNDPADEKLQATWQRLNKIASFDELPSQLAKLDQLNGDTAPHHAELVAGLKAAVRNALEESARRTAVLEQLAVRCEEFALMDFTLLYDVSRKLFSIGYNVATHKLDGSYYDLLASEARLASFVAIALGQVPQEHWFALGRLLTFVEGRQALISWSGSMFEYLMPQLVMPAYEETLLDVSCHSAVTQQIEYGKQIGVPWGISESGYNLTDAQSNYQYRAFGVPGLGFKRGLSEDIVVAPYASGMALMLAPREACLNLERLRAMGAAGRFGFYEALDYTDSRLPRGKTHALVQSFMAHHQGMVLLALAHCVLDRPMQRRFRANPFFKAAELLLQERLPKESSVLHPHELETERTREPSGAPEATYRVFTNPQTAAPEVHLLSNGRYHVMVTAAGGGYSICNGSLLTRWREDPTRDCWGQFIYLRDVKNGAFWSTAHQPTLQRAASYEAIFSQGRAEFRSRVAEIASHTEIAVSAEDDIEVRRVTLTNHSDETRVIEITSFAEVALNTPGADNAHPAFSKLFIQTEILPGKSAIACSRRPRARGDQPPWMFHLMLAQGNFVDETSFETDRAKFLGRGRDAVSPIALEENGPLSNSAGAVLDPAVAIRRTVRIKPKESARVVFITGSAAAREPLLNLIEKYQDNSIADRVFELAWTHGLVTLHHLNATEAQAQLFERLAGALLYNHPMRRAAQNLLKQNRRGQRNLWSFGISGDLPIVLVHATSAERIEFVRELLQAHAYWRLKGLAADLVIVNEDNSVYRQSVHDQIMSFIASGIEAPMLDRPGGIFVRRGDQLSPEDQLLLQSVARIVLSDENGSLVQQLQRKPLNEPTPPMLTFEPVSKRADEVAELPPRDLIFSNGFGGFTPDGHEYVITLRSGQTTPAPWVNVIANPSFGTLVSESGSAYTWEENCHEFRLTPWHNDPVSDTSGEAFYIRDDSSGRFWSPTPLPARGWTPYVCRHGFGYTVFEHQEEGISSELWLYVAMDAPMKFARLVLRNTSQRSRSLSVMAYWEWVLGDLRHKNCPHIVTELDQATGAVLARNCFNNDFDKRVAFVGVAEASSSFTCDRAEFIGRNGTLANPAAMRRRRLSGRTGAGLDACTALQVDVQLQPGEEREVIFKCGVGRDREAVTTLQHTYRRADACRDAIYMVHAHWNDALSAVQVETPDPALNVFANGWLIYQTLSCRLWGRTGFYQSGGAFGFRDQLQDAMALVHSRPTLLREQLLRAAAHQFREGDVQHWWHPPSNRGVRTHFSDDYLWLPLATCRYVEALGDTGVLDEKVPFLEGRPLRPDEENYYDTPRHSGETDTLYEHCVRALRNGLRFGAHGLPLIGCGDWNDGMNLIGEHGKGESVWLAFFLFDVLKKFSVLADQHRDPEFARHCREQAKQLLENIERNAWDGEWYRRAYFDNGEPLGSASNPECQIDSLPQSWAVLSGIENPERVRLAMDAVAKRLVRSEARLIQLFDPPFDKSALEPGYIRGYVPGVRENGGQYTHGAIWTIMAFAEMGDVTKAWELFNLIHPTRHAESPADVARYKVEPYVIAADVYSVPPHTGRGGWTWYTGSAGWFYRLITETFLGLRLDVDKLHFAPRLPVGWKSFKIFYRYRETHYHISLNSTDGVWLDRKPRVILDGVVQSEIFLSLADDHRPHSVELHFA